MLRPRARSAFLCFSPFAAALPVPGLRLEAGSGGRAGSESGPSTPTLSGATSQVRVIVADDHPLVLFALERLIAGLPNLAVVARARTMDQLFDEAGQHDFDLAVTDLYMPGGSGEEQYDAIRRFRREFAMKPVVLLTMETEAAALRRALELDVEALLSKQDRIDLIPVAIMSAMAHEQYVGPVVRDIIARATREQRREEVREKLSRREFEVLAHYAAGRGVTEIAVMLGRSVKTISAQKCSAMKKLSLTSEIELYRFAFEFGVGPGDIP